MTSLAIINITNLVVGYLLGLITREVIEHKKIKDIVNRKNFIELLFSLTYLYMLIFQASHYSNTLLILLGFFFALSLHTEAVLEALKTWVSRK